MTYEEILPKIQDLKNIFDFVVSEAERLKTWDKSLEEFDRKLHNDETGLNKKLQELYEKEQRIKEAQAFNVKSAAEIRIKNEALDRRTVEVNTMNLEYDKKKTELLELNVELTDKIAKKDKILKDIEEKEKDLEKREVMMAKEVAIDSERKDNLNLREQKIKEREAYLQRVMQTE